MNVWIDTRTSHAQPPVRRRTFLGHFASLATAMVMALGAFAPADAAASVRVRTADIDISSVDGAQVLLRRLERASQKVCRESVAQSFYATRRQYAVCVHHTLEETVGRLDAPLVRQQYLLRLTAMKATL